MEFVYVTLIPKKLHPNFILERSKQFFFTENAQAVVERLKPV